MKNLLSKQITSPRWLLISTISFLVTMVAFADLKEKCKDFGTCGTNITADSGNGCFGQTCPYWQVCQNPGSSENCSQWAVPDSCCLEYVLDEDPFGSGSCVGQPEAT